MISDFKGERIVPIKVNDTTFANHIMRYVFASEIIKEQFQSEPKILDVACGAGYGTYYLKSQFENGVCIGKDISLKAIEFAKSYYLADGLSFEQEAIEDLRENQVYDAVVSIETAEHLLNLDPYFAKIYEALAVGGVFIMSVPDRRSNIESGFKNKYHLNEMYLEELLAHLRNFRDVEVYIQFQPKISKVRRVVGSLLSTFTPYTKDLLVRSMNRFSKIDNFTGKNFSDWFLKSQSLTSQMQVLPLPKKIPQRSRLCYVIVAKK